MKTNVEFWFETLFSNVRLVNSGISYFEIEDQLLLFHVLIQPGVWKTKWLIFLKCSRSTFTFIQKASEIWDCQPLLTNSWKLVLTEGCPFFQADASRSPRWHCRTRLTGRWTSSWRRRCWLLTGKSSSFSSRYSDALGDCNKSSWSWRKIVRF